jgi:hypothetical protein
MELCYVVQKQDVKMQTEFFWLLTGGSVGQMRQRK